MKVDTATWKFVKIDIKEISDSDLDVRNKIFASKDGDDGIFIPFKSEFLKKYTPKGFSVEDIGIDDNTTYYLNCNKEGK